VHPIYPEFPRAPTPAAEYSIEFLPVALLQLGYILVMEGGKTISMVPEAGMALWVVKLTNIYAYYLFMSSFRAEPEAITELRLMVPCIWLHL
jgi:hypothetical protein